MRSFDYTIHIDRTPETVWAYMMDFSKSPRWRNLVRTIDVMTPGPLAVGSHLLVTFDISGRQEQTMTEVWAFEPARRLGLRNTAQNVTGVFDYRLSPENQGTKMQFTCDIRPHGLMWLLMPWLLRGNRARYEQQLPNLKKEVEKEPAAVR